MWHSVLNIWRSDSARTRPQAPRRRRVRLCFEQLEDRLVPSNFTAVNVSDLIADINAANKAGGSNTITLTAPTSAPYNLSAVDNTTDGATGLPVIAANDNLTILGNGDTIARSTATGTPAFRLLDVASGASLKLANLTLQGGLAQGVASVTGSPKGGAIFNSGTLDLNGVTVQNNIARGWDGARGNGAWGGGIYSSGSLTLENGTKIQNNQALGGRGYNGTSYPNRNGGPGGFADGGGLYVSAGTATLTDFTLSSNTAHGGVGGAPSINFGGTGGNGGNGLGGGLYAGGGSIVMHNDRVTENAAQGGAGGSRGASTGVGEGGGLYINALATLDLDAFTLANIINNTASTSNNDIYGSYTMIP
jgi:hypothetical protein